MSSSGMMGPDTVFLFVSEEEGASCLVVGATANQWALLLPRPKYPWGQGSEEKLPDGTDALAEPLREQVSVRPVRAAERGLRGTGKRRNGGR